MLLHFCFYFRCRCLWSLFWSYVEIHMNINRAQRLYYFFLFIEFYLKKELINFVIFSIGIIFFIFTCKIIIRIWKFIKGYQVVEIKKNTTEKSSWIYFSMFSLIDIYLFKTSSIKNLNNSTVLYHCWYLQLYFWTSEFYIEKVPLANPFRNV